jgi:hypothetical protein
VATAKDSPSEHPDASGAENRSTGPVQKGQSRQTSSVLVTGDGELR